MNRNSALIWLRPIALVVEDPRVARIRRFSADRITAALLETEGRRDIERLLAIGECCPYARARDCQAIWIEEFRRLWA
jgi:hypothetical protein